MITNTQVFSSMTEYARHLESMGKAIAPAARQGWLRRVMGETIRDLIKVSFLAGKNGNGGQWLSTASDRKFGNRWSKRYVTRPSGDEVTADKVRLTDTEQLRNSYKIITCTPDEVTVGPTGTRQDVTHSRAAPGGGRGIIRTVQGNNQLENAKLAEHFETVYQNIIAGWGTFRDRIMEIEVNKVWEHFANGIPISRIRKPRVRAM